ncbi:MAG: hypothetical protein AAB425_04470, partial [Bdellovibrionota bacterium]
MNFSSFFGLMLGASVLYLGLKETTDNILMFLDLHSILLVIGGTTAAASISYLIKQVQRQARQRSDLPDPQR